MFGLTKKAWLRSLAAAGLPEVVTWIPRLSRAPDYEAHSWQSQFDRYLAHGKYHSQRRRACVRLVILAGA